MDSFQSAYRAWRGRPFPPGSADDAFDELHADLALADSWVAESVVPYVESGTHQPAKVDVLTELSGLRRRAERLEPAAEGDDAPLAADYCQYIDILMNVYTRFLALGERSRG
jgi:hypothetical protein